MFAVSSADLNALYTGIQLQLLGAYNRYTPQLRGLAIETVSTQMREAYPIQAISATMQRWQGNRDISNLIQKVQYLDNGKPWSNVIAIKRQDIELKGRTLDMSQIAIRQGKAAKALIDEILKTLLQGGASAPCIDGKNFFATDHPVVPWDSDAGTYTNLRTNFPLNRANFRTAYQYMLGLKGWDKQPFEVDKFYLVVSPGNQAIGQEIVESSFAAMPGTETGTSVGANNVDRGKAQLIVSQKLSNEDSTWYLISTEQVPDVPEKDAAFGKGGPLAGPFVLQQWRSLEVVPRFSLESENVFQRDEYEIGLSQGLEGGYLLPQHAVRCVG